MILGYGVTIKIMKMQTNHTIAPPMMEGPTIIDNQLEYGLIAYYGRQ